MLLIALLVVGIATPLVSSSTRGLAVCGGLTVILLIAVGAAGETATGTGSMIGAAGVITTGLLIGGVARALLFRDRILEDRIIRRGLPRESPPRYR